MNSIIFIAQLLEQIPLASYNLEPESIYFTIKGNQSYSYIIYTKQHGLFNEDFHKYDLENTICDNCNDSYLTLLDPYVISSSFCIHTSFIDNFILRVCQLSTNELTI